MASMAEFNAEMSPSRPLGRWDSAFMVEPRGICDSEGIVWLEGCEEGIFAAVHQEKSCAAGLPTPQKRSEALPVDPSTWTNFYRKLRTDLVGAWNPAVLRYWIDSLLLVSCGVGVRWQSLSTNTLKGSLTNGPSHDSESNRRSSFALSEQGRLACPNTYST